MNFTQFQTIKSFGHDDLMLWQAVYGQIMAVTWNIFPIIFVFGVFSEYGSSFNPQTIKQRLLGRLKQWFVVLLTLICGLQGLAAIDTYITFPFVQSLQIPEAIVRPLINAKLAQVSAADEVIVSDPQPTLPSLKNIAPAFGSKITSSDYFVFNGKACANVARDGFLLFMICLFPLVIAFSMLPLSLGISLSSWFKYYLIANLWKLSMVILENIFMVAEITNDPVKLNVLGVLYILAPIFIAFLLVPSSSSSKPVTEVSGPTNNDTTDVGIVGTIKEIMSSTIDRYVDLGLDKIGLKALNKEKQNTDNRF